MKKCKDALQEGKHGSQMRKNAASTLSEMNVSVAMPVKNLEYDRVFFVFNFCAVSRALLLDSEIRLVQLNHQVAD